MFLLYKRSTGRPACSAGPDVHQAMYLETTCTVKSSCLLVFLTTVSILSTLIHVLFICLKSVSIGLQVLQFGLNDAV